MRIDDQQTDSLLKIVLKNTGTDLTGYRRPTLSRRISGRLARLGMDAEQYLSVCQTDKDECESLIKAVAINVSSFFRDPIVFETIAKSMLPELIREKKELRVWSAGCAAGEEAYSLAILIREECRRSKNTDCQPVIFATDIDRDVLQEAKEAFYPRERLEDTKLRIVDTCFSPVKDGFQLRPEVKKMVHFSFDDLLADEAFSPAESVYGSFDIVLCRNVVIYFSDEKQEQAFRRLYKCMAQGGYLVLGDSETVLGDSKSRFKTIDAKNKIYQK